MKEPLLPSRRCRSGKCWSAVFHVLFGSFYVVLLGLDLWGITVFLTALGCLSVVLNTSILGVILYGVYEQFTASRTVAFCLFFASLLQLLVGAMYLYLLHAKSNVFFVLAMIRLYSFPFQTTFIVVLQCIPVSE